MGDDWYSRWLDWRYAISLTDYPDVPQAECDGVHSFLEFLKASGLEIKERYSG